MLVNALHAASGRALHTYYSDLQNTTYWFNIHCHSFVIETYIIFGSTKKPKEIL